jgi:hypothetical protein
LCQLFSAIFSVFSIFRLNQQSYRKSCSTLFVGLG